VIRKYINLRLDPEAYRIIRKARLTAARADEQRRNERTTKLLGAKALFACRQAWRMDERINFRHLPESKRAQLQKWRALVEADLQRIAGDNA
jgi:hypothetical protein